MKKTIILILVLLPIVLLAVIAMAGRVLSLINHISVESVEFVDRIGTPYTNEIEFVVPQGGTKDTKIRIYPELASNKKVTYTSSNTDVCTVDESGIITGVHWGKAVVTVKTQDSSRVAMLNVLVSADVPVGVTLSQAEANMFVGGTFDSLTKFVDARCHLTKVYVGLHQTRLSLRLTSCSVSLKPRLRVRHSLRLLLYRVAKRQAVK